MEVNALLPARIAGLQNACLESPKSCLSSLRKSLRWVSQVFPALFRHLEELESESTVESLMNLEVANHFCFGLPEELWRNCEILGWCFQGFVDYDKKQVSGRVSSARELAVVTQLFTPKWVSRYLVHNSLGRYLKTRVASSRDGLRLNYLLPSPSDTFGCGQLDLTEMTILDPAAGTGHLLLDAYEVMREAYLKAGYDLIEAASLILENNLVGLDIDERAIRLAETVLLLRANLDDPGILERQPSLSLWAYPDTSTLVVESMLAPLGREGVLLGELAAVFEAAPLLGSLIEVPQKLQRCLPELRESCEKGKLAFFGRANPKLLTLLEVAQVLCREHDVIIANPPFMGRKHQPDVVRRYLTEYFSGYQADLFSAFIVRCRKLVKEEGHLGFMTPFVWMFIGSYAALRYQLLDSATITSVVQLEYSAFAGATVPICCFTFQNKHDSHYQAGYVRLSGFKGVDQQGPRTLEAIVNPNCGWLFRRKSSFFNSFPQKSLGYFLGKGLQSLFETRKHLSDGFEVKQGLITGDTPKFVRYWFEVDSRKIYRPGRKPGPKTARWFPYLKGGDYRKWYGNHLFVVDWEDNGCRVKSYRDDSGRRKSRPQNERVYFKQGLTWTKISSSYFAVRICDEGSIPSEAGMFILHEDESQLLGLLGYLNSSVAQECIQVFSQTLNFEQGAISKLPVGRLHVDGHERLKSMVAIAREDWNSSELSWDFETLPWLPRGVDGVAGVDIESSLHHQYQYNLETTERLRVLEIANNCALVEHYGLKGEVGTEVSLAEITLMMNPVYRYGRGLQKKEYKALFLQDAIKDFISYAIGCFMGRYSLKRPGLMIVGDGVGPDHLAGNDLGYSVQDGIIPLSQGQFPDEAASRLEGFISLVWGHTNTLSCLSFIAGILGPRGGESPQRTIQRYFTQENGFYKDHLQKYKRRPIYWKVSSGKLRSFECLVYVHGINPKTLSVIRERYVEPLILALYADLEKTPKRLPKKNGVHEKIDELRKMSEELEAHEWKMSDFDLDRGVIENYRCFSSLLSASSKVLGEA
ncbi:MAG: BREX-1 system adenine-specific DNA-methyltransferase PglX [Myxococcota bacterium]|nr:BREX-1 system adenine-specific DNA-methyltransferase PglX [Myxococcota bacterium]